MQGPGAACLVSFGNCGVHDDGGKRGGIRTASPSSPPFLRLVPQAKAHIVSASYGEGSGIRLLWGIRRGSSTRRWHGLSRQRPPSRRPAALLALHLPCAWPKARRASVLAALAPIMSGLGGCRPHALADAPTCRCAPAFAGSWGRSARWQVHCGACGPADQCRRCAHCRHALSNLACLSICTPMPAGGYGATALHLDGVTKLSDAGILFVASAGNGELPSWAPPCCPMLLHAPMTRRKTGRTRPRASAGARLWRALLHPSSAPCHQLPPFPAYSSAKASTPAHLPAALNSPAQPLAHPWCENRREGYRRRALLSRSVPFGQPHSRSGVAPDLPPHTRTLGKRPQRGAAYPPRLHLAWGGRGPSTPTRLRLLAPHRNPALCAHHSVAAAILL